MTDRIDAEDSEFSIEVKEIVDGFEKVIIQESIRMQDQVFLSEKRLIEMMINLRSVMEVINDQNELILKNLNETKS